MMRILFTVLAALSLVSASAHEPRTDVLLSDGWGVKPQTLHKKNIPFEPVTLPHTWNAGYLPGTHSYNREMMIYHRFLDRTPEMDGRRVFLRFEGANSACDVFVNHRTAGSHLGGYTAFCVEITDLLKPGKNELEVWVSNAYRTDVLPIMGDFNVYGGLHRPVHLLITDPDCISPLHYGGPGVHVRQETVDSEKAVFSVETVVSAASPGLSLRTSIEDRSGRTVLSKEVPAVGVTVVPFELPHPHLWQGKEDPYLYTVKSELLRDGKVVDAVSVRTGFRSISVDTETGYFLNGRHYDLYGFCRHEDFQGRGSALLPEHYRRDMDLVLECGATALRLVHYPHGEPIYDLSDEEGIVIMTEIPMCGPGGYQFTGAIQTEGFMRNARQVTRELVYQKINHPSICFWGIFNEVLADSGSRYGYDDPEAIASEINDIYHSLDRSRPTTLANAVTLPHFLGCADVIGINKYYAWYGPADPEKGVGPYFDEQKKLAAGKAVGITEYGGGASIFQHESPVTSDFNPESHWHPEENQNRCHELNWDQLKDREYLWGKFIWVFQDFQSQIRTEGDRDGINDKGLVTYDRSVCKDAFFFYKALWNPAPMVYITSRRFTEREDAQTEIKVYTNLDRVEFFLNGKKCGKVVPDALGRASVPVTLSPGENEVKVVASRKKVSREDSCIWKLE